MLNSNLNQIFVAHKRKIEFKLREKFENPEQLKQDVFEHSDIKALFKLVNNYDFLKEDITTGITSYFELSATAEADETRGKSLKKFLNPVRIGAKALKKDEEHIGKTINEAARTIQTLITLAPKRQ